MYFLSLSMLFLLMKMSILRLLFEIEKLFKILHNQHLAKLHTSIIFLIMRSHIIII